MGDMRDVFDGMKEQYKERVAKTPDRIKYAIAHFKKYDIEYTLKNETTGHFHCRRKCDDKLVQFWAGKGTIMIDNETCKERGIHSLITLLCKEA